MISNRSARYQGRARLKLVTASLALLFLQLPLASYSAEHQVSADQSGVTWQGLELGDFSASSIDGWREALSESWTLGGEAIFFTVGSGSDRRDIRTCEQLLATAELHLQMAGSDRRIIRGWRAKCKAVRAVVEGISPQKSFIGDFALDKTSVKALPAGTAFIVSRDDKARVEQVRSRSGTLGDLLGGATINPVTGAEVGVVQVRNDTTGKRRFLSFLAQGDFDRDGFDDLLLYASGSMAGGSYSASSVYIVSRLEKGGPLVLRGKL